MQQMRYTPLSPTQVEQSSKIKVESKAVEVKEESKITFVEYDSKKIAEVLGGAQKEDRGSNGPVYLIAIAIGLLIYYAKTPKEQQENITPLPQPKFYETKEFKMLEKASQAEPEIAQSSQQKEDYSQMKTIVLIPFELTPPDPDWLYKYYEGVKLTREENDLLQQHLFDLQHQRVIKNLKHDLWKGIPSRDKIVSILLKAKDLKDRYNIQSQYLCHPARYNARLFPNPFIESKGGLHTSSNPNPSLVFAHWNQEVKEDLPIVKLLMKHYDIPVHGNFFLDNAGVQNNNGITPARDAVNAVYQAKYGLFTCGETHLYVGQGDFNTLLINIWENQQEKQRKMWYLAIACGLKEGMIKYSDIEEFRIRHPKGLSEKRLKQSKERVAMERQLNLINR
ncbi:hypothetical protein FGO68_gene10872 [Halteria grandinella]|uniref:Uncharacterized protein n=1 Tax=Halteria grandinella TaxID=5974 RepID=A0A8J8NVR0_HALGN|nr:hypothetical protein FGO68_gene10872 [Halteria grandinella]